MLSGSHASCWLPLVAAGVTGSLHEFSWVALGTGAGGGWRGRLWSLLGQVASVLEERTCTQPVVGWASRRAEASWRFLSAHLLYLPVMENRASPCSKRCFENRPILREQFLCCDA